MITLTAIEDASKQLQGKIFKTPIIYSPVLSALLETPVYLKCEHLQLTGSFKIRGAFTRLNQLTKKERQQGLITCSAGNHGKAVGYIAQQLGIPATIYVPRDIDAAKYEGILATKAKVIRSPYQGYDKTEKLAKQAAESLHIPFISAFDDWAVMTGNGGTLAKEILEEYPQTKTILFPVGGGGLGGGLSFYTKEKFPHIYLIGCQHHDSPGLQLSLSQGQAISYLPEIETVAGGIEGGLGQLCFEILQSRIDYVALLSEEEILVAFRWMLKHHQFLIEPSSAVVIAACLTGKWEKIQGPILCVLSGRNVCYQTIQSILAVEG